VSCGSVEDPRADAVCSLPPARCERWGAGRVRHAGAGAGGGHDFAVGTGAGQSRWAAPPCSPGVLSRKHQSCEIHGSGIERRRSLRSSAGKTNGRASPTQTISSLGRNTTAIT